jgi:hypothetical protein
MTIHTISIQRLHQENPRRCSWSLDAKGVTSVIYGSYTLRQWGWSMNFPFIGQSSLEGLKKWVVLVLKILTWNPESPMTCSIRQEAMKQGYRLCKTFGRWSAWLVGRRAQTNISSRPCKVERRQTPIIFCFSALAGELNRRWIKTSRVFKWFGAPEMGDMLRPTPTPPDLFSSNSLNRTGSYKVGSAPLHTPPRRR